MFPKSCDFFVSWVLFWCLDLSVVGNSLWICLFLLSCGLCFVILSFDLFTSFGERNIIIDFVADDILLHDIFRARFVKGVVVSLAVDAGGWGRTITVRRDSAVAACQGGLASQPGVTVASALQTNHGPRVIHTWSNLERSKSYCVGDFGCSDS